MKDLFEARDRVWGIQKPTPYMEIFSQAIQRLLKEDDEDDMMGVFTQDILTTVKHAEAAIREEQFRQSPESQSQSFETWGFEEMPDGELQDHLSSVLLHQQDCETTKGFPVEDDGYEEGEWVCPYTDCVICSPTSTVRKPDFEGISDNVEASESWEVSPTIPFVVEAPPSNNTTPVVSPFTDCGGIRAFSRKRKSEAMDQDGQSQAPVLLSFEEAETHPVQEGEIACSSPAETTGLHPEHERAQSQSEQESDITELKKVSHDSHVVQVLTHGDNVPFFVRMSKEASVGSITVAEDELGSNTQPIGIRDSVGQHIPFASKTTPFQQLFLHNVPTYAKHCKATTQGPAWTCQPGQSITRIHALRQQEAWVAADEMAFYLTNISQSDWAEWFVPFSGKVDDQDDVSPTFTQWFADLVLASDAAETPLVTAFVFEKHWYPVVVVRDIACIRVFTSPEGLQFVEHLSEDTNQNMSYHTMSVPQTFRHDCGFSCVGWLVHVASDASLRQELVDGDRSSVKPFTTASAVAWRGLFEHHLLITLQSSQMVQPHKMIVGGASSMESPEYQIAELLKKHGVPEAEAMPRSKSVIDRIGRMHILQALRSGRVWAELKSLANQQQPKVQLVLPSELADAIRARADTGQPFGDKRKKAKHSAASVPKGPIVMQPADVTIPDGLFKQGETQLIRQINISAIRKDASGIVVVNANQAEPYLRLS